MEYGFCIVHRFYCPKIVDLIVGLRQCADFRAELSNDRLLQGYVIDNLQDSLIHPPTIVWGGYVCVCKCVRLFVCPLAG